MARKKKTTTEIKLYEIDTKAYLSVKNIRHELATLKEFINGGGMSYALANSVPLARALERYATEMEISDIATMKKDGQACETWFRKSGFLDSSNSTYKLSPIAEALIDGSLSLSEYALMILTKQWIKITPLNQPVVYGDNLLEVIIEFFTARSASSQHVAKTTFVVDLNKYVLNRYSSSYKGLQLSNDGASRYLEKLLLLSGVMVESGGNYSLNPRLLPFFLEYDSLHGSIRDIASAGCSTDEEKYFNSFEYGIFDLQLVSSKDLMEAEYPGLFKCANAKTAIYYGAPGTGKSYKIDKMLETEKIPDSQVKRVIFHPDYTYTDFIGGLSPEETNGRPGYVFKAGPFTEILRDAFKSPGRPFFLVIEEINRGNAAAIFGDVFQLLDRKDNGVSKYTISNKDICGYLKKEGCRRAFPNDRFGLPGNLAILCTMNTADQNVFVLDSAFKRRFTMEYVPIDFSALSGNPTLGYLTTPCDCFADSKAVTTGTVDSLFNKTDLDDYFKKNGNLPRTWETFAKIVNEKINIINSSEETISEDKKLGPFFVTKEDLADRKRFADKVLYYLKQDVFKYTQNVLAPSYQELYDRYVGKKEDIFEIFASSN